MTLEDRLTGKTILLTRDGGLGDELRLLGARVVVAEVTWFEPVPADFDLDDYDWIVYTSPRAVAYSRVPRGARPRVASVGPATALAVAERGGVVARSAPRHDAESLCAELVRREKMKGAKVLFPCSDRARPTVAKRLGAAGAEVTSLVVYRTVVADELPPDARNGADAAVFLAPSSVDAFVALGGDLNAAMPVAIGETTAASLRKHGREPVVAPTADRSGLIEALLTMENER